ncbi:MAG: DUF6722 family protein [Nitrospirota bacterium]
MTQRQRENLARYAYDVSKIMVAVPILGNSLSEHFSLTAFWLGIAAATIFLLLGFLLDRREEPSHDEP